MSISSSKRALDFVTLTAEQDVAKPPWALASVTGRLQYLSENNLTFTII